jgi:glycosyltransferase involved in cell wall biosynthesis
MVLENLLMKILHYSLGLPPYRSGGLTKYSHDLMIEEVKQNQDVYLLFPGKMGFIRQKTSIKEYRNYKGIHVYELINPLPVPLLNGIINSSEYMKKCNKDIYINFIKRFNIDVVHIHTFMGLHKEMLEACRQLHIKVVYTTHDYFGLCTRVNFIDCNGKLCEDIDIDKCIRCNLTGSSLNKIKILQSRTYRFIKNNIDIRKLKKISSIKSNSKLNKQDLNLETSFGEKHLDKNQYQQLINYYKDMFGYIDKFLFNSNVAKEVYKKYIKCNGIVVSITHGDIKDNRKIKDYSRNKLRLTYLGPNKKYKGVNLLIKTMEEINRKYKENIELNLYGDISEFEIYDNIKTHGRYSYNQLNDIFDNTDLLIVPSIWNETFGFIVLEAISYGVPVLMTDKVGSKDIVNSYKFKKGIIIKASKLELRYSIIEILNNREILNQINKNILEDEFNFLISQHCKNINKLYTEVINDGF